MPTQYLICIFNYLKFNIYKTKLLTFPLKLAAPPKSLPNAFVKMSPFQLLTLKILGVSLHSSFF